MDTENNGRDEKGQFAEGNPGRPAGTENKLTRKAKYLAERLFEEFERQGIDKLTAEGDVRDLINLISKFVPKEIKADVDTKLTTHPIKIEFED